MQYLYTVMRNLLSVCVTNFISVFLLGKTPSHGYKTNYNLEIMTTTLFTSFYLLNDEHNQFSFWPGSGNLDPDYTAFEDILMNVYLVLLIDILSI